MLRRVFWIPVLLLAILPACGGAKEPAAEPQEEAVMMLELTSAAFEEGSTIPTQHTCDGLDVSPPLSWSGPPAGTKSLALIGDDPDAPVGTWVHWVLYDLSPSVRLPETDTSKEANLALVCDLLDKIAKVLENFARLTVPVQWAILGLLNIGLGAYLIANRPF